MIPFSKRSAKSAPMGEINIRYVHLGCLRHWIRGRLNLADRPLGSYFYRCGACRFSGRRLGPVGPGEQKDGLIKSREQPGTLGFFMQEIYFKNNSC